MDRSGNLLTNIQKTSDTALAFKPKSLFEVKTLLIISLLFFSPDVEFCGYSIPHPSEKKVNLRIQTKGINWLCNMLDHKRALCSYVDFLVEELIHLNLSTWIWLKLLNKYVDLHKHFWVIIYVFSGPPAVDVFKKGLADLTALSEHVLETFEVWPKILNSLPCFLVLPTNSFYVIWSIGSVLCLLFFAVLFVFCFM